MGKLRPREGTYLTQGHTEQTPMPLLPQVLPCAIKWIQSCHLTLGGIRVTLGMLVGEQLGNRQHDTPSLPHPSAPPQPWQCLRAPGLHWQLGSGSFVSPGRFSGLLCVSLSSLSLSQGLLSAKVI